MNKTTGRLILNLLITIVILLSCIMILISVFVGAWLHTYRVFTQKTLVAEITVSELRHENDRDYFEITYKPVKATSALVSIFRGAEPEYAFEEEEKFNLEGDEVRIGGQVIKFQDPLNLLGFKTVYKITRLEGSYLDADKQNKYKPDVIELNGGVDEIFKYLQEHEDSFAFAIDTVIGDYPGKNVQSHPLEYGLYVTEEGFLLDRL